MSQQSIQKRNHVKIFGKGEKPIIFAHGFGCDQQVWHRITPAFEERYKIYLFDYVGSGYSDKAAYDAKRYRHIEGYAQDVLDICHAYDLKNVIFIGHSISGTIGLMASIKEPELFDKVCMIGSSPHYINEPDYHGGFDMDDIDELIQMMELNYLEWARYLAPIASKNEDKPKLTDEFEQMLLANDREIVKHFCRMTFTIDVRDQLEKATAPTLLLQSADDTIVPFEISQYMADLIPNSTLVKMKATGHNPHLSAPEETIETIKNWLEK